MKQNSRISHVTHDINNKYEYIVLHVQISVPPRSDETLCLCTVNHLKMWNIENCIR